MRVCGGVFSCSVMSDSLQEPVDSTRLLCPWDSPGKNTGVSCHSLPQGTFLTQGRNPDVLRCRQTRHCRVTGNAPSRVFAGTQPPGWLPTGRGAAASCKGHSCFRGHFKNHGLANFPGLSSAFPMLKPRMELLGCGGCYIRASCLMEVVRGRSLWIGEQ